jgi:transcription elongation factor Elf1
MRGRISMIYKCPKCSSEQTQSLSIVYQSGLSEFNATTSGNGISNTWSSNTSGTKQTRLSAMAAPPGKRSYIWLMVGFFVIFIIWVLAVATIGVLLKISPDIINAIAEIGKWLIVALWSYFTYRAFVFNRNTRPLLIKKWESKFICLRCGHVYFNSCF